MKVKATGIKNFKIVKKNYEIAHGLLYKLKLLGTLQLNTVIFRQQTSKSRSQWSIIEMVFS